MITLNNFSPTVKKKNQNDGFGTILREAHEYFTENNIQMVSGFHEIISDDTLFSEYVNRLTNGLNPDEADQVAQLLENQRFQILQESTISQISPLAGLAMPTVRKMWVKTAMKNAIPTETAKVPSFTISWMEPYLRDADGTKHSLPTALRGANSLAEKPAVVATAIDVPADNDNLLTKTVIDGVAASVVNHDAIDPNLFINKVTITVPTGVGDATESKDVAVSFKASLQGNFYGVVNTVSNHAVADDRVAVTDTLFGAIDFETGVFSLASVKGLVTKVFFKGCLTQENNTRTQSVSFDIKRKDVRIGTGAHLNAPLPIEWLQDSMALFNIDATVQSVDIMSNVTAQKLDMEIIDFLDDSFVASGSPFVGKFDVKPSAGFAGSPTEWRHELRTTIEWWATKLKSATLFSQGYFVICGNPLDINLIPDINWQFRSVQGERGGVNVNYDLGVLTTNNVYQIVSSDNIEQGKIKMFFCPNVDDYMSYKYFPYSFNIEKGYLDPQMPNVPSIMMTKRHTIEELIPMQVQIEILHNDGSLISSYAL